MSAPAPGLNNLGGAQRCWLGSVLWYEVTADRHWLQSVQLISLIPGGPTPSGPGFRRDARCLQKFRGHGYTRTLPDCISERPERNVSGALQDMILRAIGTTHGCKWGLEVLPACWCPRGTFNSLPGAPRYRTAKAHDGLEHTH